MKPEHFHMFAGQVFAVNLFNPSASTMFADKKIPEN